MWNANTAFHPVETEIALAWTDKTLSPPLASLIEHIEREAASDLDGGAGLTGHAR